MNFNFFNDNPKIYKLYMKHAVKYTLGEYETTQQFIKTMLEDILYNDSCKLPVDYRDFYEIMLELAFGEKKDEPPILKQNLDDFISNVNIHYKPEVLNRYTKNKLHRLCKMNNIKLYSQLNKKELINLIKKSI